MMSEWKTYKLSELVEIKYGKDHKHMVDGDIPVYGSGGIMRYAETHLYDKESILIPRKGTLSNLFYLDKPFWSVDTMFYTKIKNGVHGKYLYYLLKSMDLASMNVGSAVPSLTTEVLNKVEISLPDLPTQRQIAQILSSLDDKIELNLQMNQTLEAMAQAIFKEWFVNFNFPGFDGELVDGLPKGWKINSIGDLDLYITDLVANGSFSTIKENVSTSEIPDFALFIRNTDLKSGFRNKIYVNEHSYNFLKKSKLFGGELILSNVGDIGSVHLCPKFEIPMTLGNNCIMVRSDVYEKWLYLFFLSDIGQHSLNSAVIGSVQAKLSKTNFKKIEIPLPPEELILEFNSIINQLLDKIEQNEANNRILTETLKTTTPKLMSGQLEVV